jgi:uncharacterized protein
MKKSRVSSGRSVLTFGTALSMLTRPFYQSHRRPLRREQGAPASGGSGEIGAACHATGMAEPELVVQDHPDRSRYEILRDGEVLGNIAYRLGEGRIVLVHTEVSPLAEGQGIGSRLVAGALADVRSRGLRLVAMCPFVRAYLERHPEERD